MKLFDVFGYYRRRHAIKKSHLRAGPAAGEDVLGDVPALIGAELGAPAAEAAFPAGGIETGGNMDDYMIDAPVAIGVLG